MKSILSYDDVPYEKHIYIYGTGAAGRAIFSRVNSRKPGIVKGFVDSYARGRIEGLPIFDPVDDLDLLQDATILIASQAWMGIHLRLQKIGLSNLYNAYPLYMAPYASSVDIDTGFLSQEMRAELIQQIAQSPETDRFAVLGNNGSAESLVAALRASSVAGKLAKQYDLSVYRNDEFTTNAGALYEDHRSGRFERIILAVPTPDVRSAMRRLRIVQGSDTPVWVPSIHIDRIKPSDFPRTRISPHLFEMVGRELTEKSGTPLIVVVPPCAGTMRFLPQIEHLLNLLGWAAKPFMPLTCNPAFYGRFRDKEGRFDLSRMPDIESCYIKENTESYYWFSKSLQHFEYTVIHDQSIDLAKFAESHCKIIVLMRDPRDVFNSFFYRSYPFDLKSRSEKEFMLDLLDGETRFANPEYGHRWASAGEWTDSYLAAMESPNMEIVRFEDLHRDEVGTLRDILSRLELCPNPFFDVTDETLRIAAHLGSFEHQTNGQATRGEERQWIVGQTSCRKGVVGDWRSTFTPAVVEKFKRLTGDALVRLGYEDSVDWGEDGPAAF